MSAHCPPRKIYLSLYHLQSRIVEANDAACRWVKVCTKHNMDNESKATVRQGLQQHHHPHYTYFFALGCLISLITLRPKGKINLVPTGRIARATDWPCVC